MSCLPRLMITALENALSASEFIFRKNFVCIGVTFKKLHSKDLTLLTRRRACQHS